MNKISTLKSVLFLTSFGLASVAFSQDLNLHWQHADYKANGLVGVSSNKAITELTAGKTPSPIVVAIIDSGTESFHPDLNDNIWVNTDEIAGNGIDDDKNGYIDDVHGWSFLGGKNGDVEFDNLEFTRVYADLKKRFEGKNEADVASSDKEAYKKYVSMKDQYATRLKEAQDEYNQYMDVMNFYAMAKETMRSTLGKSDYTIEEVAAIESTDEMVNASKEFILLAMSENFDEQLPEWKEHVDNQLNYSYNLDFNSREIIGDNYADPRERNYGNNHVDGPAADHGTHVAGIVGAERNGEGLDGICQSAQLMIVRVVPNGDELDKDVANGIRYAVDNGAKVINMSFGKSHSPYKSVVDEAVRYAESKGVLLVHAAGNDGRNLDKSNNFPNKYYEDGGECKTWIEVGASDNTPENLPASFSNYGKKKVDVFAPGVDIYSTVVNGEYKKNSGTSMASPVTAGVAAAVWAYYPTLTAAQVREIIVKSAVPYKKQKVTIPGSEKTTKFKSLSKTGAVVNLYEAMKMAEKMTVKK